VRIADEDFVPFVPRQLAQAIHADNVSRSSTLIDKDAQSPAEEPVRAADEPTLTADAPTSASVTPDVTPSPEVQVHAETTSSTTTNAVRHECDHALEIRNEAVRLAAVACGKALRHAVMLHPRVIAAFVDDAIAAAGHPLTARIRVHPASVGAIATSQYDRVGDDCLSPGEVVVECDGVNLGADVDSRAELLVSAAAEV
jgi:hypothetical protein